MALTVDRTSAIKKNPPKKWLEFPSPASQNFAEVGDSQSFCVRASDVSSTARSMAPGAFTVLAGLAAAAVFKKVVVLYGVHVRDVHGDSDL